MKVIFTVSHDPLDLAWKVYTSVADTTGKADAKASIAITLELAILTGLIAASSVPGSPMGFNLALLSAGIGLLTVAVLFAIGAVLPRTSTRLVAQDWRSNNLYLGNLRRWSPDELSLAFRNEDPLPQLSELVIVMSKIAWRKQQLVKLSIGLSTAGVALVVIATLVT